MQKQISTSTSLYTVKSLEILALLFNPQRDKNERPLKSRRDDKLSLSKT